jgi:uncharacterized protein YbbC (DUF1343 family)
MTPLLDLVRNLRVGLVTHPAARQADGTSTERFVREHARLVALFGPEHGLTGEAQDLIPVAGGTAEAVRVHSLYGDTFQSLTPTAEMLAGLDVLVIDLIDIGSRYYTFQATMLYCLEACAKVKLPVIIVDRPNPLGRTIEGPTIQPGFDSFVGPHPVATRHGCTMGELARLYMEERDIAVSVTFVDAEPTCAPWIVPPSPNMPTLATAVVYPGGCLIEGTNMSEGRGTTRPFEYLGHPQANGAAIAEMLGDLPGVQLLPVRFTPTFQKHAGRSCGGVFVTPEEGFQPVRTGLALLWAFRKQLKNDFRWRTETYEFVSHIPAIDLLFGSARERMMLDADAHWREIAACWRNEEDEFARRVRNVLSP